MRTGSHRWVPFGVLTGAALGLWILAAAHGYAWEMIWLPAAIAGAAWPRRPRQDVRQCLRRVQRDAGQPVGKP
jgi:hypothetical protein